VPAPIPTIDEPLRVLLPLLVLGDELEVVLVGIVAVDDPIVRLQLGAPLAAGDVVEVHGPVVVEDHVVPLVVGDVGDVRPDRGHRARTALVFDLGPKVPPAGGVAAGVDVDHVGPVRELGARGDDDAAGRGAGQQQEQRQQQGGEGGHPAA
jgi:hypothetical protein